MAERDYEKGDVDFIDAGYSLGHWSYILTGSIITIILQISGNRARSNFN